MSSKNQSILESEIYDLEQLQNENRAFASTVEALLNERPIQHDIINSLLRDAISSMESILKYQQGHIDDLKDSLKALYLTENSHE